MQQSGSLKKTWNFLYFPKFGSPSKKNLKFFILTQNLAHSIKKIQNFFYSPKVWLTL